MSDIRLEPAAGWRVRPCGYQARAWSGDELVAESTQALRLDRPGQAPTLWFPWSDVRSAWLRPVGRQDWDGGAVEGFEDSGERAGTVQRCTRPPAGLESLADHAAFDQDRFRLELVDAADDDDPRDVTVKRFPNWGDAADLIAVLDAGAIIPDHRRPVVEGSQLLGQTIVAAMRGAPGRRVASVHMLFLRAVDANRPVDIGLDTVTKGKTFTAFAAQAGQGGRACAIGTVLLGRPAGDVVRHAGRADGVPGPYDAVPYDMGVTGRDLRVVDAAYTGDPDAPLGPPSIDAWVRFRRVPDEPAIHAGLLAQFTGHLSIAAALRPHAGVGQWQAHRTMSTAINAIALSFHADVRVDRWILYRHHATVVADGMAHSECRVYDEARNLVASFSVDAMIRPMLRADADDHTAL
jgi:acyl-CoA thioesterase II